MSQPRKITPSIIDRDGALEKQERLLKMSIKESERAAKSPEMISFMKERLKQIQNEREKLR